MMKHEVLLFGPTTMDVGAIAAGKFLQLGQTQTEQRK